MSSKQIPVVYKQKKLKLEIDTQCIPQFECTIIYRSLSFKWPRCYMKVEELSQFFPLGNGLVNKNTNEILDITSQINLMEGHTYEVTESSKN